MAQLVVAGESGEVRGRGSGYLVAPGVVLTAGHVVAGAAAVTVVLDAGGAELSVRASSWCGFRRDAALDLAVVKIAEDAHGELPCPPVPFGRVVDESGTLAVVAVGFPLFKMRPIGSLDLLARDSAHVFAQVPLASNRRDETWEVSVQSVAPNYAGEESPWAGFSGSAVWCGGVVVGVVVRHHQEEGKANLTAVRIDLAVDRAARLRKLLGFGPGSAGLRLADVRPPGGGRFISTYLKQVVDPLAPRVLVDRDVDLADMTEFALAETVESPYRWYRAAAWAGKSALFAWWVLNPPPNVDVLPYFITARRPLGAARAGFVEIMLAQLREFLHEDVPSGLTAASLELLMLTMLNEAAQRSTAAARRLILVVDGLDEDDLSTDYSIAALLPEQPAHEMRVMVSGRLNPDIPYDVSKNHPLRRLEATLLAPSKYAHVIGESLEREIRNVLNGPIVGHEILGLIVASGGGLTTDDLDALTGEAVAPWRIRRALTDVTGRTYRRRPGASRGAGQGWELAHVELLRLARRDLGAVLNNYRARIHSWVASWKDAGWPAETPAYLLFDYPRLLRDLSDAGRLTALAVDGRRHRLLERVTGSDYAALQELAMAQDLVGPRAPGPPPRQSGATRHLDTPADPAGWPLPDLAALGRLAVARAVLVERNKPLPPRLPAIWLCLGWPARADAMALSLGEPARSRAQSRIAHALAKLGSPEKAASEAGAIADPFTRATTFAELAVRFDGAGAAELASRAYEAAEAVADDDSRVTVQLVVAGRLASMDKAAARKVADAAEQSVKDIWNSFRRDAARVRLVAVLVLLGDAPERIAAVVREVRRPEDQARAWQVIAGTYASEGQFTLATAALDELLRLVPIAKYPHRIGLSSSLAHAQLAEALAGTGKAGDRQAASRYASAAHRIAKAIRDPEFRADAIGGVLQAVALTGRPGRAARMARDIDAPNVRCQALVALARVAKRTDRALGLLDDARQAAMEVTAVDEQAELLTTVAERSLPLDRPRAQELAQQAEEAIRQGDAADFRSRVLLAVATSLSRAGEGARAETVTRALPDGHERDRALLAVAQGSAEAGDPATAERAALAVADHYRRDNALAVAAKAYAAHGMPNGIEQVAAALRGNRSQVMITIVRELAGAGAWRDAERLARGLPGNEDRQTALVGLAIELARHGQWRAATELAQRVDFAGIPNMAAILSRVFAKHDPALARSLLAIADTQARALTHPELRAGALEEVVRSSIAIKDWARARGAAAENPYTSDRSFGLLVDGLLAAGRTDDAKVIGRQIREPEWLAAALVAIGVSTSDRAFFEEAFRVTYAATSYDRNRCITRVAEALAIANMFDEAVEFVISFDTPVDRRIASAPVFVAMIAAERWDDADKLLSPQTKHRRDKTVIEAVRSLADTGKWAQAVRLTWAITDSGLREQCQAELVNREPSGHGVLPMLAGLLLGDSWLEAAAALGATDPAAAVALHETAVALGLLLRGQT